MQLLNIVTAFLSVGVLGTNVGAFPSTKGEEYSFQRTFLSGNYRLLWKIIDTHVDIMMQAKTTGWVGIGLSPSEKSGMKGSDIIMGAVVEGIAVAEDFIAEGNQAPVRDTDRSDGSKDLDTWSGWEEDGWTTIMFRRDLTPDDPNDAQFPKTGVIDILVAYGPSDEFYDNHASSRERALLNVQSSIKSYSEASEYRTYDGTGNNVQNPKWGSVGDTYRRDSTVAYSDGVSEPGGKNLVGPRTISNVLFGRENQIQPIQVSSMIVYIGQFIAHDVTLAGGSSLASDQFPITIPKGDPTYDFYGAGEKNMSFTRTAWDPSTGTSTSNPRKQVNGITSFLDASMVYGESEDKAKELRSGVDGKLLMDENGLLPMTPNISMAAELQCPCIMRKAGDVRANENSMLFTLHTVYLREHNQWCVVLKSLNPSWNDEKIFQEARRRVIALWQKMVIYEYLPAVLGYPSKIWTAYDPKVVPQVTLEFAAAAFRYGHSEINSIIPRVNKEMQALEGDNLLFRENLFNAINGLYKNTIEPGIRGVCQQRPGKVDTIMVSDTRNFLFGNPLGTANNASDLVARSIQRGRENGIPSYNTVRESLGLPKATSWADITKDEEVLKLLPKLYNSVDDVELYVGGLAEQGEGATLVGPLYAAILEKGFNRLRDGDRFWFENGQFEADELREIFYTRLADVIRRNTNLGPADIPENVFYLDKRYTSFNMGGRTFGTEDGFPNTKGHNFDNSKVVMATYKVLWTTTKEDISFMLQVKTTGWVGIGFNPDQRGVMKGADIFIGRVLPTKVEVIDYKATMNVGKPFEDVEMGGVDDTEEIEGWEEHGWTTIMFKRKRDTGDTLADHIISSNLQTFTIFAYQEETDLFNYHGPNVAGVPITFSDPPMEYDILHINSVLSKNLGLSLCVIGLCLVFACLVFQTAHRDKMRIKVSSPQVNLVLLFGSAALYLTVFLLTLDGSDYCDENTQEFISGENLFLTHKEFIKNPDICSTGTALCTIRLVMITTGFSMVFGTMFAKMYRVHKIFNNPQLARVRVSNMELLRMIAIFLGIDALVLTLWTLIDPITLKVTLSYKEIANGVVGHHLSEGCSCESVAFWIVLIVFKAAQICMGMYMAYRTRSVSIPELNDYNCVVMATYNIFIISVMVLPFVSLLRDQVVASTLLSTSSLFLCVTGALGFLYFPKMIAIFTGQSDDILKIKPGASQPGMGGVSTSKGNSNTSQKAGSINMSSR